MKKKRLTDVKFDSSLILVFLAALILLLSFAIYSKYGLEMPDEEYEELLEEIEGVTPEGDECTTGSDCPQPRCLGMEGKCENGYCIVRQTSPTTTKCFDLQATVCGNKVCEGDEKDRCPEDCEAELICNFDGVCEYDLTEKYTDWLDNEDSENCPDDCRCGDGICDDYERETNSCLEDC